MRMTRQLSLLAVLLTTLMSGCAGERQATEGAVPVTMRTPWPCPWPAGRVPEVAVRTVDSAGYPFTVGGNLYKIPSGALTAPVSIRVEEVQGNEVAISVTAASGDTIFYANNKLAEVHLFYGPPRCGNIGPPPPTAAVVRDLTRLATTTISGYRMRAYSSQTSYYVIAD
ncbi:MAG TPA: hypothetical protein VMN60_14440 [Longimicrobiales bacterium]|nr:hypothetical protein [Longimicrobiales bacterium]